MQNIELKVRVPDLAQVRSRVLVLGAEHRWTRTQTDTYFAVNQSRLKLREVEETDSATLISYVRADDDTSRISHYRLLPVSEGETLKQMLTETLGVITTVSKTRDLYLAGMTRIHLDEVEHLGTFVELETVIREQSAETAWAEHQQVRGTLQLDAYEPVPFSYSDLMMKRSARWKETRH